MTGTTSSRRFGVALIGLFVGALAGFMVHEVIGAIVLGIAGTAVVAATGLGLLLFYLTPIGAVAGLLLALGIDSKRRRTSGGSSRVSVGSSR